MKRMSQIGNRGCDKMMMMIVMMKMAINLQSSQYPSANHAYGAVMSLKGPIKK